jgi:hypothetical protein
MPTPEPQRSTTISGIAKGMSLPAGIAAMGPHVVERVEKLVAAAERRQAREIADATQAALDLVPWPLRALTRRLLGL